MLWNLKEFKLPEIEEKILKFERKPDFEKTLKLRAGAKLFRFSKLADCERPSGDPSYRSSFFQRCYSAF